jgi:hypothetical protein
MMKCLRERPETIEKNLRTFRDEMQDLKAKDVVAKETWIKF